MVVTQAQILLLRTPASDPTHITVSGSGGDPSHSRDVEQIPGEMSMTDILQTHKSGLQSDRPFDMVVKRDKIWRSALSFYKNCVHHPQRLYFEPRVEFEGEEGIDAGARAKKRVFPGSNNGDE